MTIMALVWAVSLSFLITKAISRLIDKIVTARTLKAIKDPSRESEASQL